MIPDCAGNWRLVLSFRHITLHSKLVRTELGRGARVHCRMILWISLAIAS